MEPDAASRMDDLIPILIGTGLVITFIAAYAAIAAWVASDAQKRGYSGRVPVLWLCSGGPLCALIWLAIRPSTRLAERPVDDYANADDAMDAAAKLDMLGDWDEAIVLYQYTAARWPEHEGYANQCIKAINNKRGGE